MHTEPQPSLNTFQPTDNAKTIEQGWRGDIVCILHWFNAHIGQNTPFMYIGDIF